MNNSIDNILIGCVTALLLSIVIIFIRGKRISINKRRDAIIKSLPLTLVFCTIISVFYINYYYKKQLELEVQQFELYKNQELKHSIDSLVVTKEMKGKTIDSLKLIQKQLDNLIVRIQKQEKITGEKTNIIQDIKKKISKTNFDIETIQTYNEILDKNIILKTRKGYTVSDNIPNFEFYCPEDRASDYLDLKLKFQDESLIDKIAYIYIEVTELEEKKLYRVYEQIYTPQKGMNVFKIENYLRRPNMKILVGYVLKTETDKEYPIVEKVECKS